MRKLMFMLVIWAVFGCCYAELRSSLALPPQQNASVYRLALLSGDFPGGSPETTRHLMDVLGTAGFDVTELPPRQVASSAELCIRRFDGLMIPNSPAFPACVSENVDAFARAGGDLILLGGHAFSTPVAEMDGRWVTQQNLHERFAAIKPKDVYRFDSKSWVRDTNYAERNSQIAEDRVDGSRCLRINIRDFGQWNWDMFSAQVTTGFPAEHNLITIRARTVNAKRTPRFQLTVKERNGNRWSAWVPLTEQWNREVVHAEELVPIGKQLVKAMKCRLENVTSISMGLAGNDYPQGDHTFLVNEIGTAKADIENLPGFSVSLNLNIFDNWPANEFCNVECVVATNAQWLIPKELSLDGSSFSGRSAVGYPLVNKSEFMPLLSARDQHGHHEGWAAGLLVNYAGPYKNSHWLLFGINEPAFYRSALSDQTLVSVLRTFRDGNLSQTAMIENNRRKNAVLPVISPPPGRIRLSDDGKHLVRPDGQRFFMVGANYIGPSDRKCHFSEEMFDPVLVETDFQKAQAAGINCFRIWTGNLIDAPQIRETLIELARKYQIYLLIHCDAWRTERSVEDVAATIKLFAEMYRDEPAVLGFDLRNEPYIGEIAALTSNGRKSPLLQLKPYDTFAGDYDAEGVKKMSDEKPKWPKVASWLSDQDRRHIYAALSILQQTNAPPFWFTGDFRQKADAMPPDGAWRRVYDAVNESFKLWIDAQMRVIREVSPNLLVTVGYNTALAALPANEQLDFVSHHAYGKDPARNGARNPDSRYRVVRALDALVELWPDKPITIGEFGYSNGDRLDGQYMDMYDISVGEMIHYLASLSHGVDGCMKWSLTDWSVHATADVGKWIAPHQRYPTSGYGMFRHDGTAEGVPKPLAEALPALRAYVDRGALGGDLQFFDADMQTKAGYVFRGPGALFVGGRHYSSPALSFDAENPANVMLLWTDHQLRIVSSADASLRLRPGSLIPGGQSIHLSVTGRFARETQEGGILRIDVMEGEPIVVGRDDRKRDSQDQLIK